MISLLIGKPILTKRGLTILINGVGYAVFVSPSISTKISSGTITLFIYTHVKEECLELYGFLTEDDRELFLLLLSVNGVGPRTALAIVEKGGPQLITAVQEANIAFFSSIPRIGKKLSQKIIIELKSKLGSLQDLDLTSLTEQQSNVAEALIGLGFDQDEVERVVRSLDPDISIQQAIQLSIKQFGR